MECAFLVIALGCFGALALYIGWSEWVGRRRTRNQASSQAADCAS